MIHDNDNSDLSKKFEYVDVYLFCNKLSLHLLANNTTTCPKKCHINDVEDVAIKAPMTNTTKKKRFQSNRLERKVLRSQFLSQDF